MNNHIPTQQEPHEPGARTKPNKKGIIFLIAIVVMLVGFLGYNFYKDTYWAARKWTSYQANDGSFKYPSSWKANFCQDGADIEMPGYIKTEYMEQKKHKLTLEGFVENRCLNGKVVLNSLGQQDCSEPRYGDDHVAKLANGAYLRLSLYEDKISRITIDSKCQSIFSFNMYSAQYPDLPDDLRYKYDSPAVPKDDFLKSAQYKDIVKFAESINLD